MAAWSISEVNDRIIDFLRGDSHSLLACSLVSRDFNARSWNHLFCTIVITNGNRMQHFVQSIHGLAFRHYVHKLVLGHPKGRRAPHIQEPLRLDTSSLLGALSGLPNLQQWNIIIRDVRWSPIVLSPPSTAVISPSPHNLAYILLPVEPSPSVAAEAQKTTFVLPTDPLLADMTDTTSDPPAAFEIVEASAVSLVAGRTIKTPGIAENDNFFAGAGEVALQVQDPSKLEPVTNPALAAVLRNAQAISIRWLAPVDFLTFDANTVVHHLRLSASTHLRSVTLWITLHSSGTSSALQQWTSNLALLQEVPPDHIARVGVGIFVDGEGFYDNALVQVKQIRWLFLLSVLARFPRLARVEVMIAEKERLVEDEMWAAVYDGLDGLRALEGRVRLARTEARML